jgi:hypothetical protein
LGSRIIIWRKGGRALKNFNIDEFVIDDVLDNQKKFKKDTDKSDKKSKKDDKSKKDKKKKKDKKSTEEQLVESVIKDKKKEDKRKRKEKESDDQVVIEISL